MNLLNLFKKFLSSPLLVAIAIYLFFQLQIFNLGLDLQDEGFFSYLSSLIAQGQVPYRDFVLTPTPGSFYLLAILFKTFGNYLIINRVIALFFSIVLLITASSLFNLEKKLKYIYLLSLSALLIHPTDFGGHNNSYVILLVALFFLIRGFDRKKIRYFVLTGIFISLCFIFKQSFGILALPTFFILIFLFADGKNRIKFLLSYILSSASVLLLFFGYFYLEHSLNQLIYYVFQFAGGAKGHQTSFIVHRLIFIPVFIILGKIFLRFSMRNRILLLILSVLVSILYLSLSAQRIGRFFDYLDDPVFYVYSLLTFLPLLIIILSDFKDKIARSYIIYSFIMLVLFLGIAASGYNIGVLYVSFIILIPLLFFVADKYLKKDFRNPANLILVLVAIGMAIYLSFNPITSKAKVKEILSNQYNSELPFSQAKFIKIKESEKEELTKVINYVRENTPSNQKIFCFPLCPTMYFLTDRNNATPYNIIFFETFLPSDQEKAIELLKRSGKPIILIQKKGDYFPLVDLQKERFPILYNFLISEYKLSFSTKNFDLYK